MNIVNKVQTFKSDVTFDTVKELFPNFIEYIGRPTMIKVRIGKNTILFLKNKQCRIIGNAYDQDDMLLSIPIDVHDCRLVTMTCSSKKNQLLEVKGTIPVRT